MQPFSPVKQPPRNLSSRGKFEDDLQEALQRTIAAWDAVNQDHPDLTRYPATKTMGTPALYQGQPMIESGTGNPLHEVHPEATAKYMRALALEDGLRSMYADFMSKFQQTGGTAAKAYVESEPTKKAANDYRFFRNQVHEQSSAPVSQMMKGINDGTGTAG